MKAFYQKHILQFKKPSGTSRGILTKKETYFLILKKEDKVGVGECGILRSLSYDDCLDYELKIKWLCENINQDIDFLYSELWEFPSIRFGLEQALLSIQSEHPFLLFPSDFTSGEQAITINGLIWMGNAVSLKKQIYQKLQEGFRCLKMKIGALSFDVEYSILKEIRNLFSANEIELRVDANGAFHPSRVMTYLDQLSKLDIHSIEQPIRAGQWDFMSKLCKDTPIPIALDEELIGIFHQRDKQQILDFIKPQYIIIKPSLLGGYKDSEQWIHIAEQRGISWWITSALESNVGLNAISQWTYMLKNSMPQGLGTGSLYTNNINSPLSVSEGGLRYNPDKKWRFTY